MAILAGLVLHSAYKIRPIIDGRQYLLHWLSLPVTKSLMYDSVAFVVIVSVSVSLLVYFLFRKLRGKSKCI